MDTASWPLHPDGAAAGPHLSALKFMTLCVRSLRTLTRERQWRSATDRRRELWARRSHAGIYAVGGCVRLL